MDVAFYYLRQKIKHFPELRERKVTTVDTYFTSKVNSLWTVYKSAPDKFEWSRCETCFRTMLGLNVKYGASWYNVDTVLMPMHLGSLEHWVLVKLDLTNWTMDVYDSMEHAGPHNTKVREGVEALASFIPLMADNHGLFSCKPRARAGTHPIPFAILKQLPQQSNGGDCGMFTIKYAECLIEGRDVRYWVIDDRMRLFREWLARYLWAHAKRKQEEAYKSDVIDEDDF